MTKTISDKCGKCGGKKVPLPTSNTKTLKAMRLFDSVFLADVWFLYSGSVQEVVSWYKKKKITSDFDPKLQGYVELLDYTKKDGTVERTYIIRVEHNDFYTLAHECIHLVKHIFTDRGVPFRPENDETIAYYHGYWLKRLWRLTAKD